MAPHVKVKMNQWLITAAVGLFGIWGGYRVLQYQVENNSKDIVKLEKSTIVEKDASVTNSTDIKLIKKDVSNIQDIQTVIQKDIKAILQKVR